MLRVFVFVAFSVFVLSAGQIEGRNFRPDLLPIAPGGCNTRHTSGGGSPRNAFGQEVERRVSPGGREAFWTPALAALDSDGDGVTNGQELGDPDGDGTRDLVVATGNTVALSVVASAEDLSGVTHVWTVNGVTDAETGSSLLHTVSVGDSDDRVSVNVSDGAGSLTQFWAVSKTLKGDFNGNNVVDFPDFLAFVIAFGKSSTDADFNASMDLSGNGTIDFPDFLTFVSFFGLTQ